MYKIKWKVYKKFLNMLLSIRGFDAMIFEKSIFLFIWQSIDDISCVFRIYILIYFSNINS